MKAAGFNLGLSLIMVMCLCGCATAPSGGVSTTASPGSREAAARADQTRTSVEGTAAGVVLGGLVGLLTGHDSASRLRNALIGAGVGGIGGYGAAQWVNQRKQQFATTEAFLDDAIRGAKKANAEAVAYNRSLNRQIAQLDRDAKRLKTQRAGAMEAQARLDQIRRRLRSMSGDSEKKAADLRKQLEYQQAVYEDQRKERAANDARLQALEAENRELEAHLNEFDHTRTQLAEVDSRWAR